MRRPELELSLLCEGAGIDPVSILSALNTGSDLTSAEDLARSFRGVDVDRMMSLLSIAGARGAVSEVPGDGESLDRRKWRIDKGAFVALVHEAKVIYDSMPEIRSVLGPESRYRISATLPGLRCAPESVEAGDHGVRVKDFLTIPRRNDGRIPSHRSRRHR